MDHVNAWTVWCIPARLDDRGGGCRKTQIFIVENRLEIRQIHNEQEKVEI